MQRAGPTVRHALEGVPIPPPRRVSPRRAGARKIFLPGRVGRGQPVRISPKGNPVRTIILSPFLQLVLPALPVAPRPAAALGASPPALARDRAAAADAELMAWAASGDRLAFDALVGRHAERVLRVALRVLGDPDEAEEVAQEALLRAWRNAAGFDPARAKFSTWLHRIVLNLAIDRARRRRVAPHAGIDAAEGLADPGPGPDAALLAAQDAARLQAALAALPPRQRAAIVLAAEGMRAEEAAAALSVSRRALEGLLRRARQWLGARLREEDLP